MLDEETALAEPPDVHAGPARAASTSARKASSARSGSISARSSSRTIRTPATRFASFARAAQRAVWLSPQSVEKASRSGGAKRRTVPDAIGDVLGRLDVVALHVDHADGDVLRLGDRADELDLGELAARHLEVDLVDVEAEERGEERLVPAWRDGAALVVPEAEMRGEARAADDRARRCG